MAMNGTNLGDEMLAAIQTLSSADQGDAQKCMRKMGEAIVAHIHAHAVVSGSVDGVTVAALTPGAVGAGTLSGGSVA